LEAAKSIVEGKEKMLLSKKQLITLSLIVAIIVSVVVVMVPNPLVESSTINKIGKIEDISYWKFAEPNKPSSTGLIFEDGDVLVLKGVIENIEIGRTYFITYHKQHYRSILGSDHPAGLHAGFRFLEWSGEYYILDSIEEV